MHKFLIAAALALIITFTPVSNAKAQDENLLSLGLGWYDINDDKDAVDFRVEYRHGTPLMWVIKPWIGAEGTSDGAIYGVGGLLADIIVGDHFLITPSFGAGLYHDGDGKDLGHAVEFRSQLELGYRYDNGHRSGIAFGHISNASIGDKNPGTEILNLYYHIPLSY